MNFVNCLVKKLKSIVFGVFFPTLTFAAGQYYRKLRNWKCYWLQHFLCYLLWQVLWIKAFGTWKESFDSSQETVTYVILQTQWVGLLFEQQACVLSPQCRRKGHADKGWSVMPVSLTHILSSSWISSSLGYLSTTPASWRQVLSRSEIWIQQQQYRAMNPVAGWKTESPLAVISMSSEAFLPRCRWHLACLKLGGRTDGWAPSSPGLCRQLRPPSGVWRLMCPSPAFFSSRNQNCRLCRQAFLSTQSICHLLCSGGIFSSERSPQLPATTAGCRSGFLWKLFLIHQSEVFPYYLSTVCSKSKLEIFFFPPGWIPAPPCSS